MRQKIKLCIISIYILAFSPFLLDLLSLKSSLGSYILLGADVIVFYLGITNVLKNKFNLFVLLGIVLIGVLNYLSNDYELLVFVNGMRELLVFVLIFSFYESISNPRYQLLIQKKINKFITIFLVAQLPVTFFQFIQYGAGDQVGGTLGVGNSGVLTLTTILMVYLRIKQQRPIIGLKAYYNVIFLVPLFLNETKISFILIPVMFLCLANIKKASTIVVSLFAGLFLFLLLNSLYSDQGQVKENPFEEMFNEEYLEMYLLSEVDLGSDIPRFTKIAMASNLISRNINSFLFGMEVGAFKGGTTISLSKFATQYKWFLLGSKPYLFFLLISGGWLLLLITIFYFYRKLFYQRGRYIDKYYLILITTILLVIFFYNDSLRNPYFCYLFIYFVIVAKGGWIRTKIKHSVNFSQRLHLNKNI